MIDLLMVFAIPPGVKVGVFRKISSKKPRVDAVLVGEAAFAQILVQ